MVLFAILTHGCGAPAEPRPMPPGLTLVTEPWCPPLVAPLDLDAPEAWTRVWESIGPGFSIDLFNTLNAWQDPDCPHTAATERAGPCRNSQGVWFGGRVDHLERADVDVWIAEDWFVSGVVRGRAFSLRADGHDVVTRDAGRLFRASSGSTRWTGTPPWAGSHPNLEWTVTLTEHGETTLYQGYILLLDAEGAPDADFCFRTESVGRAERHTTVWGRQVQRSQGTPPRTAMP